MRGDYVLNIQGLISHFPHILIHNPFPFEFTFPEEQKLFYKCLLGRMKHHDAIADITMSSVLPEFPCRLQ